MKPGFRARLLRVVVTGAIAASVVAATSAFATDRIPGGGSAVAGRETYLRVGCWTCHGYAAQGGTDTGPALAGKPYSFEALATFLRTPLNLMPPYTAKVLSDAEVQDILAFLKGESNRKRP